MFTEDIKEINKIKQDILLNSDKMEYRVESFLNNLAFKISCIERTNNKKDILNEIATLQNIFKESPFINRTHTWPRGYPGDFETIEYIFNCLSLLVK